MAKAKLGRKRWTSEVVGQTSGLNNTRKYLEQPTYGPKFLNFFLFCRGRAGGFPGLDKGGLPRPNPSLKVWYLGKL